MGVDPQRRQLDDVDRALVVGGVGPGVDQAHTEVPTVIGLHNHEDGTRRWRII